MPTLGVLLLIELAWLISQLSYASQHLPSPTLAFLHATIIDGTDAPIQPDMTVVVSGNRITEIGETHNVRVPHEAKRIDATGKFIIPGLWDMHVHWYLKDYLPLFIANGVLGIRLMWGVPKHHAWRKEIEQGTLLGPRLVIASRIVDGLNPIWRGSAAVGNAAQAREGVRQEQQEGADFIKIYNLLTRDAFFAVVDEAKQQGLRFAGHVPYSISAVEASEAGQHSIEHLTGILLATSTREEELREMTVDVWTNRSEAQRWPSRSSTRLHRRRMLETFSPQKATALFAHFKRNGTWQTPTMTVLRNLAFLDDPKFRADPRLKYVPTGAKARWEHTADRHSKSWHPEDFALSKQVYRKQMELVGMMHREGVKLLAGSDVLNPYCLPGFSLHDELGLLVDAGLTPRAALQTATLNPARFLGKEQEFGTVNTGKRADFVLLNANPLEAIKNSQQIHAVVMNGHLLDRVALDGLLDQVAARVKQSHLPPLPDDLQIVTPQPDVAPNVAAFSGKWSGRWADTLDHVLVVEKIEGLTVTFVYSWGIAAAWNITHPGFRRVTGRIDQEGILRGTLRKGVEVAYRLSPDQHSLAGEYMRGGRTTRGSFKHQ